MDVMDKTTIVTFLVDEDTKAGWYFFTADTTGDVVWDIAMGNGLMTSQSVIHGPNIRLNSMDVSENDFCGSRSPE